MTTYRSPSRMILHAVAGAVLMLVLAGVLAGCSPQETVPPEQQPPGRLTTPAGAPTSEPAPTPESAAPAPDASTPVPAPGATGQAAPAGPPSGSYKCRTTSPDGQSEMFSFRLTGAGHYYLDVPGAKGGFWTYDPATHIITFVTGTMSPLYEGIYVPGADPAPDNGETIVLRQLEDSRAQMESDHPTCRHREG